MSGNETAEVTSGGSVARVAIQRDPSRKSDAVLVAFFVRCLELGEEVDRRRAGRTAVDGEAGVKFAEEIAARPQAA